MQIPGIGLAKATAIVAAIELGKRAFQTRPAERQVIEDPATATAYLSHDLMWQEAERFAILLLDVRNRVLGSQVLTIGTATETLAHPPDIFREVIRQGANRANRGSQPPHRQCQPQSTRPRFNPPPPANRSNPLHPHPRPFNPRSR